MATKGSPSGTGAANPKLTWKLAQTVLNENDMKRIACLYFHLDNPKPDYNAAAQDFGSASAHSMRVMMCTSMAKVKAAAIRAAQNGDDAVGTGEAVLEPSKVQSGGKKRKAGGEHNENSKNKKGKKTKEAVPNVEYDEEMVKSEPEE